MSLMGLHRLLASSEDDAAICEAGGRGLVLPLLESEYQLDKFARAVIYFVILIWCFLGVSIVADVFMNAIETITSRKTMVKLKSGAEIPVRVWNQTVANLTLLALGSSAPEIMLAVIEIAGAGFYSGDLGPSTIVGSAIFNMLIIIAVCVCVIPEGEGRLVAQTGVYIYTGAMSIFAYVWLIIVVQVSSPDVIDIWEAILTLTFFPILVVVSFLIDIGQAQHMDAKSSASARTSLLEKGEGKPDDDEVELVARSMNDQKCKSRAIHRLESSLFNRPGLDKLSVGFLSAMYSFAQEASLEGPLEIGIEKLGSQAEEARVAVVFTTRPLEDELGEDSCFVPFTGMVDIPSGNQRGRLMIPPRYQARNGLRTPTRFNIDIIRAVRLQDSKAKRYASLQEELVASSGYKLPLNVEKTRTRVQVGVKKLKGRGVLHHKLHAVEAIPDNRTSSTISLVVERRDGSRGTLSCKFYTQCMTAKAGAHFEHAEGELEFPPGVQEQHIVLTILERSREAFSATFQVNLEDCSSDPGAVGKVGASCTVKLITEGERRLFTSTSQIDVCPENHDDVSWCGQIRQALSPMDDDDEVESATPFEWMLHITALPWKLLFALIPPVQYCRGWATFCFALLGITLCTWLIGDLASLFGCVAGLKDSVTAVTLVALGTSLPDTFASKSAAVEEQTADSAIVNVTGSNSVNVFLGMGLPWSLAALFWHFNGPTEKWKRKYPEMALKKPDGAFVVEAGDLTFSVILFLICGACFFVVMAYRRLYIGVELGGPSGAKVLTGIFFVLLWCFYITVFTWNAYSPDATTGEQVLGVVSGAACLVLALLFFGSVSFLWRASRRSVTKKIRRIASMMQEESGYRPGSWQHLPVGGAVLLEPGAAYPPPPLPPTDPKNPREALIALEGYIAGLQAVQKVLERSMTMHESTEDELTTALRMDNDRQPLPPRTTLAEAKEGLHHRRVQSEPVDKEVDTFSGGEQTTAPIPASLPVGVGGTVITGDSISPTPTMRMKKKKVAKKLDRTSHSPDVREPKDNSDALQIGKALLEEYPSDA